MARWTNYLDARVTERAQRPSSASGSVAVLSLCALTTAAVVNVFRVVYEGEYAMVFTSIEFRLRVVCVIAPELLSVLAETLEATSPFHRASPQLVDAVPARDQSLR